MATTQQESALRDFVWTLSLYKGALNHWGPKHKKVRSAKEAYLEAQRRLHESEKEED